VPLLFCLQSPLWRRRHQGLDHRGGSDVGGCQCNFLVPKELLCPVNFSGMNVQVAALQERLREELQLSGRMSFTVGSGEPLHLTQMEARILSQSLDFFNRKIFSEIVFHSKLGSCATPL